MERRNETAGGGVMMNNWFTIDRVDKDSYIVSEYRHWEETHCYLLNGTERSLLIDTGLGICNISEVITQLANRYRTWHLQYF